MGARAGERSPGQGTLLTISTTDVSDTALHPSRRPLLVFAQRPDASVDIDAWNAHGARFFGVRVGLAEAPGDPAPRHAAVRFVVAPAGIAPGIREATARPRLDDDLARARAAEAAHPAASAGLASLAARCPTLWLVTRHEDGDDPLAWALAIVISSTLLGPILDDERGRLVGAKTARAIVEALGAAKPRA